MNTHPTTTDAATVLRPAANDTSWMIPDHCGRRSMTWAQWRKHVTTCNQPGCIQVWRNHCETVDSIVFRFGRPGRPRAPRKK